MKQNKINKIKLLHSELFTISIDNNNLYFEFNNINNEFVSNDILEVVSIINLYSYKINNLNILNINITDNMRSNINPRKALYWLSGGDKEWKKLDNYKLEWNECHVVYEKHFNDLLTNIINESKTINDLIINIKNNFTLLKMYDFAIEKKIV